MSIRRSDFTLIFESEIKSDFQLLMHHLREIDKANGHKEVTVDLRNVDYISPSVSLPLAAYAIQQRNQYSTTFRVVPPRDEKLARVLSNSNFLHFLSPDIYNVRNDTFDYNVPIVQFKDESEQYSIVTSIIRHIVQCVSNLDRAQMAVLEWTLNEITENVLSHSESSIGGLAQVVSMPKAKLVGMYVVDLGIGISESLRNTFPDKEPVARVRASIEEGVTSKKDRHQGNGLYGTYRCCKLGGTPFQVETREVSVNLTKKGLLQVSRSLCPFFGTFIAAHLKYNIENPLSKALVFKGSQHSPGDYIDILYRSEGGRMVIDMKEFGETFGTRQQGRRIRNEVLMMTEDLSIPAVFDFSDVAIVSSSFADECFGKMIIGIKIEALKEKIKFRNANNDIQTIISRAIKLRAKENFRL